MTMHAERPKRDAWRAARRGLALRCPSCGRGRLLAGYLKPVDACSACGEATGEIRADDGPAWATILLAGHLVSPGFLLFATPFEPAPWLPFVGMSAAVLGLCLALLPRMKGLFVGVIWATGAGEPAEHV